MQITSKSRILIISPHPDDEAIGAGGLIGKALKEKAAVMIYYLTAGDSRQLVIGKTDSIKRLKEINEVKKFTKAKIKVEYVGEEFCRLDTLPQKDIIEHVEDVVEEFKPTLVAIPSYYSYNQDHRALYEASITALRPTPKGIRHNVSTVIEFGEPYYWGVNSAPSPNLFLDLTEKFKNGGPSKENLFDFKIKLYKCHKTQVRNGVFARSPENLKHQAHVFGREIGVELAEGYRLLREIIT